MKLLLIITIVIFFSGCKIVSLSEVDSFKLKTYLTLFTSEQVQIFKIAEKQKVISSPVGTWLSIASFSTEGISSIFCLFYRTPLQKKKGILRLIKSDLDCSEFNNPKKVITELRNIEKLKIKLIQGQIQIIFGKIDAIDIDLPNIRRKSSKEIFKSSVDYSGHYFEVINNDKIVKGLIGEREDRFSDGSSIACQTFDLSCKEEISYKCERCKFGYYEVITSKCGSKYSKYCGRSNCGEKNEPACIRGKKYKEKIVGGCVDGSEEGFCGNGLNTYCSSAGVLICQ